MSGKPARRTGRRRRAHPPTASRHRAAAKPLLPPAPTFDVAAWTVAIRQHLQTAGAADPVMSPLAGVVLNREYPRRSADPAALRGLAGVLRDGNPAAVVIARPCGTGMVELVAGDAIRQACLLGNLKTVPVVVLPLGDREARELALLDYVGRPDLNPMELAEGYQRLLTECGMTQDVLARRVGTSRPHAANCLRLQRLEPEIQAELRAGRLTMAQGKALLSAPAGQARLALARRAVAEHVSAAKLRRLAAGNEGAAAVKPRSPDRDPILADYLAQLREALGMPVQLHHNGKHWLVEISAFSEEDLTALLDLVTQQD